MFNLNLLIVGPNSPDCTLWEAVAVNEAGQIAANANYTGYGRAVLLTPVPLLHCAFDPAGQSITLRFWGMRNCVYSLQKSEDMLNWQDHLSLAGANADVMVTEPATTKPAMVYRVRHP